jgi:hypothetical protein
MAKVDASSVLVSVLPQCQSARNIRKNDVSLVPKAAVSMIDDLMVLEAAVANLDALMVPRAKMDDLLAPVTAMANLDDLTVPRAKVDDLTVLEAAVAILDALIVPTAKVDGWMICWHLKHDIAFRHQDRHWNEIAKCWSSHCGNKSRFSIQCDEIGT